MGDNNSKLSQSEPLIKISDLFFRYLGSSNNVLDGIDLEINPNEIVVIAGHSGSGKSTLLRAINGLIPHQHSGDYKGMVSIGGAIVAQSSMSDLARKVGYIFQNPENQIFMFSVERDIAFGLENLRVAAGEIRERVDWAMNLLGIRQLALRPPHELSDGQKQRVAIAGVIAMRPEIIILDEPTSLLDPFTAKSVIELVSDLHDKLGITVLLVEHRLDLVARIASRMIVLDKGRIALDGTPKEVLSKVDIGLYGVTEPVVVKLGKVMGLAGADLPMDPRSLAEAIEVREG